MTWFSVRCMPAAAGIVTILALPVAAQETGAKEAWADLRETARARGVLISTRGVTDYGTSLVAQGVRITLEDEPDALVVMMPELRIEPRGAALALIPAPEFTLTVEPGRSNARVVTFTHEGEIIADVTADRIALDLPFDSLQAVLGPERAGETIPEALEVMLGGMSAQLSVEREGAVDIQIGVDTLSYAFSFVDSRSDINQRGTAEITDLQLELTGRELDMLSDEPGMLRAAFDAGFMLRLAMSTGSSAGNSVQDIDGTQISVQSRAGDSSVLMEALDGQFRAETTATGGRIIGMGPVSADVSFGAMGMALGFPLLASDDAQIVYYRMNFDDITPSGDTLRLIGAQDFAGESLSLALDVSADATLTEDLGAEMAAADEPPFDLSAVSLNQFALRAGAAEMTGTGGFAFLGSLMGSLDDDIPDGTGDFVVELVGGDALLTRLSALGLIPADQQFFVRMMMNGLGRPVGDDHLRAEVAIRPGGQVTVNGAPLPF